MIYDINGNRMASEEINCKIIAHRGYHVTAKQNTIPSLISASDNGFEWVEIDIRKTSDGVYVLSHDNSVTLYNAGTSASVTISSANYSTIKSYTWDAAGQYKLCTLEAAFNEMMSYDMWIICDIKSGTNADIMEIASRCGAADRVLLSYGSFASAYSDRELLQRYDSVPIRCVPSDPTNFAQLQSAISNPIYADVNASEATHYQDYLNRALSCGIPVIFSGCASTNKTIWQVLASGVMANLDLNISYLSFYNSIKNDFAKVATITPSANSVSVSTSGTATITAASNEASPAGYVYGYIADNSKATLKQTAFGSSASFTVTGVSAGSTTLVLFCGCGDVKKVTVAVS